mgnify:CR=1 FL=1
MLLFSLIVAGSFSFGKTIANDIDPVVLTALRFVLASLILAVVLTLSGRISDDVFDVIQQRHRILEDGFIATLA